MKRVATFDELARRCAAQGWQLRETEECYELLGNGPPAAFGRLLCVAEWADRWATAREIPQDAPALQLTFLDAA